MEKIWPMCCSVLSLHYDCKVDVMLLQAGFSVHQLLTKREPKTKGAGSCSDVCQTEEGWVRGWVGVERQEGGTHERVGSEEKSLPCMIERI